MLTFTPTSAFLHSFSHALLNRSGNAAAAFDSELLERQPGLDDRHRRDQQVSHAVMAPYCRVCSCSKATASMSAPSAWLFRAVQIAAFELQQLLHREGPDGSTPGGEAVEGGLSILRTELAAKEALLQRAQVLRPPLSDMLCLDMHRRSGVNSAIKHRLCDVGMSCCCFAGICDSRSCDRRLKQTHRLARSIGCKCYCTYRRRTVNPRKAPIGVNRPTTSVQAEASAVKARPEAGALKAEAEELRGRLSAQEALLHSLQAGSQARLLPSWHTLRHSELRPHQNARQPLLKLSQYLDPA